ncbi:MULTISPECIES: hypothetical protein [Spirosoma]|uniref:Uncharacterized protein n=1 Tax=Spirosoma liriopis TaxID=2937440 RepID=A0ABT0HG02_9BACT|nr:MULTISPECIES: hypothetical protein [Spirosoma]MCK8491083.1 hypothetical protein [Spirosoma liriopis]UHG90465.1 hypothetical protein LQ777_19710 [Spirosoma oryzicola]
MSTEVTLTPNELIQHLGQPVLIESVGHAKHGQIGILRYVRDRIEGNAMTPTAGVSFQGEPFVRTIPPPCVRLILRPLVDLTEFEARQCFRSGFPYWDQREEVRLVRGEAQIELISGPIKLLITADGAVSSERWIDGLASPARVNIVALLRYLDSLCIDTYGYIERGVAVPPTT